jgi:lipocalin
VTQNGKVAADLSEWVNGEQQTYTGEVFFDPRIQGQMGVKFFKFAPAGDYRVVHTDFENTALIVACRSIYIAHWKYAWIAVRNMKIDPPAYYYSIIEQFGIKKSELVKVKHSGCPP